MHFPLPILGDAVRGGGTAIRGDTAPGIVRGDTAPGIVRGDTQGGCAPAGGSGRWMAGGLGWTALRNPIFFHVRTWNAVRKCAYMLRYRYTRNLCVCARIYGSRITLEHRWNTANFSRALEHKMIHIIKTMPTTQTWNLLTSALLWKPGAFQSEVWTKKCPLWKLYSLESQASSKCAPSLTCAPRSKMSLACAPWSSLIHVPVGWGGVITFMFLRTHRHSNLIIFLAVLQTQALLFHDQLPVGWGGVGWGGTITFMFLYTHRHSNLIIFLAVLQAQALLFHD